jgi:hypothetical protein
MDGRMTKGSSGGELNSEPTLVNRLHGRSLEKESDIDGLCNQYELPSGSADGVTVFRGEVRAGYARRGFFARLPGVHVYVQRRSLLRFYAIH